MYFRERIFRTRTIIVRGMDLRRSKGIHGAISRDYRTDFRAMIFRAAIQRLDRCRRRLRSGASDFRDRMNDRRADLRGAKFRRVDELAVDEGRRAVVLLMPQVLLRLLDLEELLVMAGDGILHEREQDERAPDA